MISSDENYYNEAYRVFLERNDMQQVKFQWFRDQLPEVLPIRWKDSGAPDQCSWGREREG